MQRFRFGLQPLLNHRDRIEQGKQVALAAAQRDLATAQADRDRLVTDLREHSESVRARHGELRGDELRATYTYLHALSRAIESQEARVVACAFAVQQAQAVLLEATRDKHVLETLKTRRREAYDAELQLVEARELDDANARAFGRKEVHS